jgi:hypothetical protein
MRHAAFGVPLMLALSISGCQDKAKPTAIDAGEQRDGGPGEDAPPCRHNLASTATIEREGQWEDMVVGSDGFLYVATRVGDETRVHRYHRTTVEAALVGVIPESKHDTKLAVGGPSVYVGLDSFGTSGGVWRIPIGAGEPSKLAQDSVEDIAADATHVYWITPQYFSAGNPHPPPKIKRIAISEGAQEELIVDALDSASKQVAINDSDLYWENDGKLYGRPKLGGTITEIGDLGAASDAVLDDLIVGGDGYLYASLHFNVDLDQRELRRVPLENGRAERLLRQDERGHTSGLFEVDGYLYWNGTDRGLQRIPTVGGEVSKLSSWQQVFAVTEDGIYSATGIDPIQVMPLDGCAD